MTGFQRPFWPACRTAVWLPLWLSAGLMVMLLAPPRAWAADPLAGADLKQGEQLIADKQCNACHQRKAGGDGLQIYQPGVRLKNVADLLAQVQRCDSELSLGLFPYEVNAVAAVLNRDHYRFAPPKR